MADLIRGCDVLVHEATVGPLPQDFERSEHIIGNMQLQPDAMEATAALSCKQRRLLEKKVHSKGHSTAIEAAAFAREMKAKQLLESCRHARRTLIILDEILKGTNSLDKLNGSRLFLEAVAKLPVTGIIATHDLELSKMEDDAPGRFHNWCFEIELADNITYTYKITRGVARNQNATFLLKGILKNAE